MSVEKMDAKVTKIEKSPARYYSPQKTHADTNQASVNDQNDEIEAPLITEWVKETAGEERCEEKKAAVLWLRLKAGIVSAGASAAQAAQILAGRAKIICRRGAGKCAAFAVIHAKKLAVSGVASLALAGVSAAVVLSTCTLACRIKLGDKEIGTLPSEQVYYEILSDVKEEVLDTADVDFEPSGELKVDKVLVAKDQFSKPEEVKQRLKATSSEMLPAWSVAVDGKAVVAMTDQSDALGLLEDLKNQYAEENAALSFRTKIEVAREFVPVQIIRSREDALAYLNSEDAPVIEIQSVTRCEELEAIPFETEQQADDTKYTGDVTVVQQGIDGEKYVKYYSVKINGVEKERSVHKEELLRQPVRQVELVGTKERPSPVGTGEFAQPVSGTLTSSFGQRWNRAHCGIDVGASTGTMIYAADNGTVIYSQYNDGGYGNLVQIDHGNGFVTYYGHCSELLVKPGDVIAKGDPIAKVGSTGRSTGPHLHFEVRKDGEPQNPLEYVNG